ncbi:MAG: ribbon-helix-helix domain-containing protein [Minwuiales bacterium]|nr:ribbon-helix-helix domain-containing protein [Minwuiales bacterium]
MSGDLKKRSVEIAGHRTSVSLEEEFWDALRRLAAARGVSMNRLIAEIDERRTGNLSSAIRVFVLRSLQPEAGSTS